MARQFTRDEVLWIEASIEAGDPPEEIAHGGGYKLADVLELLERAKHPTLKLSDERRDVLSLWASGMSSGIIAKTMKMPVVKVRIHIEHLRRVGLIWAHHPSRDRDAAGTKFGPSGPRKKAVSESILSPTRPARAVA